MRQVRITDEVGTSGSVIVDTDYPGNVVDVLSTWYPEAPLEVTTAVCDLAVALQHNRDDVVGDLSVFLAISIEDI